MSRPKLPVYHALCFIAMCIILAGSFSACSNGSSQQSGGTVSPSSGTGGVAFRLVWQQPLSGAHAQFTPPFDACVDRAIDTISATVSDGTTTFTGGSWPCSAHEGFVTGIPAGTNYTVQVNGISSGLTIWSGAASPITVTTGQITDAGTIFMGYVGEASAQPTTVINIIPNTWNFGDGATTVPVTDRFIVAFNKPMAISTLTTTNITLKLLDNSAVSANVSYNGANNTAAVIPSAPLAYNTQYVLQVISCVTVTSCILDTIGNPLQLSDYSNTFTTESAPVGIPNAPSGITTTPGNGQVRLDWLATNGASSYNVYYSTSSGVTTTTGTKIPDARAPFVHLGLANNQPYYYIVTAVNSFGESLASVEASTTPVFPAGNPLPPASLAVAPVSGQNTLTWDAVTGATSYNLYWSNTPITPDRNSADNVIRGVTNPFIHMNLTNGLNYCYIITSMNSSGESADSMQACGGIGGIQIIW